MTVEPASTRANRINSDSLDMVVHRDLLYGWAFDERAACEAAIYGSFTADPEPDGRRRAGLGPATGLLKTKARIARKHGSWIAVANAADKVRLDSRAGKEDLIHASVVEARHGAAVQSQRPRSDDEVSALQRSVPHCRHLGHVWC